MLNAVGREIPDEILKLTGKEPFQGNNYKEGVEYRKQGPIVKPVMDHNTSKMVSSIREALEKCGAHDGMTLGFHHHFREGDLVVNMVMKEIHDMGLKDVTICASSLEKHMIHYWNISRMGQLPESNHQESEEKSERPYHMES